MKKGDNQISLNPKKLNINLSDNNIINNNNNNFTDNTLFKSQSFSPRSLKDNYVKKGRTSEIINPEKFFQNENENYLKFKEEQKRYLDFNYNMMLNRKKKFIS